MNKKNQLLSALALSIGLSLPASFPVSAALPSQVAGQAPVPTLAPMLEKVLPAVVSVKVEGTAPQSQRVPEELKKYFGEDGPDQAQPFEGKHAVAEVQCVNTRFLNESRLQNGFRRD
jgi:serine protease DegQ